MNTDDETLRETAERHAQRSGMTVEDSLAMLARIAKREERRANKRHRGAIIPVPEGYRAPPGPQPPTAQELAARRKSSRSNRRKQDRARSAGQ